MYLFGPEDEDVGAAGPGFYCGPKSAESPYPLPKAEGFLWNAFFGLGPGHAVGTKKATPDTPVASHSARLMLTSVSLKAGICTARRVRSSRKQIACVATTAGMKPAQAPIIAPATRAHTASVFWLHGCGIIWKK